jgi:aconitate hydratase
MFHTKGAAEAVYSDTLALDLSTVVPSMAGPARPQDRVDLPEVRKSFKDALPKLKAAAQAAKKPAAGPTQTIPLASDASAGPTTSVQLAPGTVRDGSVVIAAITSCTNTSNPDVMMAAGLVAHKAVAKGLVTKPWVKTSLAPGSKVAADYLADAGLMRPLEILRFHVVGYGCTTCIGNSGPLPNAVSSQVTDGSLVVASVLSGNRNFEGRVHSEVRANYLASPPLVVAYALAGRIDIDWEKEPIGIGRDGKDVFLKDIWPTREEVANAVNKHLKRDQYVRTYAQVFDGDDNWKALQVPTGSRYEWDDQSTYIALPPYFQRMQVAPAGVTDIAWARALAVLGDSITTDHISPAGNIKKDGPAGNYLIARGVTPKDFNSYGARRGHHEVMMRGTFANVRLKNLLVPGVEGGVTRHLPTGQEMSIYDAAMLYAKEGTPLVILAGKEYGSGSSRDWAAKGTRLLGVRAVIAESYERIHRSNLVGMGVLPLQFKAWETAQSLGLTGAEVFEIRGVADALKQVGTGKVHMKVKADLKEFEVVLRVDTPQEVLYYEHGGILPYVLRQLLGVEQAKS